MKTFTWDTSKNNSLRERWGITFEEILFHLEAGDVLDIFEPPDKKRHLGQYIYAIAIDDNVFLVPVEVSPDEIVLSTIIPSRKATKHYLGECHEQV